MCVQAKILVVVVERGMSVCVYGCMSMSMRQPGWMSSLHVLRNIFCTRQTNKNNRGRERLTMMQHKEML
mgnify:CR=1 FL=1